MFYLVEFFAFSKCPKAGFSAPLQNLSSTWRQHVCHQSYWKKRYTLLLQKTKKVWTLLMACKAFSKGAKMPVTQVRPSTYFVHFEVKENRKLNLCLDSFVFSRIHFSTLWRNGFTDSNPLFSNWNFWQVSVNSQNYPTQNYTFSSGYDWLQLINSINSSHRFMAKHVCDLYELIRSNSETNLQRNWKEVENRVKNQLPLRVMSCVQLASKLTSHYKARTSCKNKVCPPEVYLGELSSCITS